MKKKIIDISRTISDDSVVYPGDEPITHSQVCEIGANAPCNITALGGWSTHFLTHIDPPLHFIKNGKSLDDIELDRFFGKVKVVEISGNAVRLEDVNSIGLSMGVNVFFKTKNSLLKTVDRFDENHVYIDSMAAEHLSKVGVNMVGIDYISVDRYGDEDYPAHKILLGANVLVLEGIILNHVMPGEYFFYAFPLKIKNANGSPVRALLKEL